MSDFRREINNRIEQTRGELSRAEEIGDDYLAEIHLGELEFLARVAAEHDVTVEGVEEVLAARGLPTPPRGMVGLAGSAPPGLSA